MKAEKLAAILERYPWLRWELSAPFSDQNLDHRKFEFITIKKMDNQGQFGDAKATLQWVAGKYRLWELTTWCILFRIGDEKELRGRYVARPDEEQTVTRIIQDVKEWHEACWGCGTPYRPPLEFVAVLKRVFRGQGSVPLPTRITVYLFN